jgi:predicted ATP-grasp superfamily ATP-dependent carboligase
MESADNWPLRSSVRRALVLDGQAQSALAVVRTLGRRGIPVIVGAVDWLAMACRSRFREYSFTYPDPERDAQGFVAAVAAHARDSVVFTCSDETTLLVTRNRASLEGAVVLAPAQDRVETAFDKRTTLLRARALGIAIPRTAFLNDVGELDRELDDIGLPVVVKPAHSCTWPSNGNRAASGTAEFCVTRSEARATVERLLRETLEMPLVQGVIRGAEVGFFGLFRDGQALLTFGHRRLRSIRVSGGASVLRESVVPHPEVERAGLALMEDLRWTGVAMVEFKFDDRTGVPHLLEINGRFWGSLPLAIAAGADFPWAAWQLATSGKVEAAPPWIPGVRSRNLIGDLRNLLETFRRGPGRTRALREFLKWGDARFDVLSAEDPVPFVTQFAEKGLRVTRRTLLR